MSIQSRIGKLWDFFSIPKNMRYGMMVQMSRFYRESSAVLGEKDCEFICRELRILTHAIEKGLSLRNVKKGFGKEKIQAIKHYLDQYIGIGNWSYDREAFDNAVEILMKYISLADLYQLDIEGIEVGRYTKYIEVNSIELCEGIKPLNVDVFEDIVNKTDFAAFAEARHSMRMFSEIRPDEALVKKAVSIATTAPSACNRQSSRVIHIRDLEICGKILDMQGGAKGHDITELLLLLSDMTLYRYVSETGLPYLDSGIFLMNLLYALTSCKLVTCPLIWDDTSDAREKIREIIDVPNHYRLMAIVQIGVCSNEQSSYAVSKRRSVDQVYSVI